MFLQPLCIAFALQYPVIEAQSTEDATKFHVLVKSESLRYGYNEQWNLGDNVSKVYWNVTYMVKHGVFYKFYNKQLCSFMK